VSLRGLLSVFGALSLLGGVLWMVIPDTLLAAFGAPEIGPVSTFLATLFGGAAAGLGIMTWLARDAEPSQARNAMVLGIAAINGLWFVLILIAVLSGGYTSMAWIPVAVYAVWTALFLWVARPGVRAAAPDLAG
jgi:hypothetical protein